MIRTFLYLCLFCLLSMGLAAQGNGGGNGGGGNGGGTGAGSNGQIGNTIYQNFNQSVNQIGDCWQRSNMMITTKNTLFPANQKKALIGTANNGDPAYSFTSPLIMFNGTGDISFWHKLNVNDGDFRELSLVLLDPGENIVSTLYTYTYIDSSGARPNGNPTLNVQTTVPITFSGNYHIRWQMKSYGETSMAMFDNIEIDGIDVSDPNNDNGYGYCRPDDVVYDTLCAGSLYEHEVPYPFDGSSWQWAFTSASGGTIDTTHVPDHQDTAVMLQWDFTASGDYVLVATEVRQPYNTTTYSSEFRIHVLPVPLVSLVVDSVCPGNMHTATFNFNGSAGPWTVTYTDGDSTYTDTFSDSTAVKSLGLYNSTTNISVLSVQGANGCPGDTTTLPQAAAAVFIDPNAGPIWHY